MEQPSISIDEDLVIPASAVEALADEYHIRSIAVFGSTARGERGPSSDIDLLVTFEPREAPSLARFVELQDRLSSLLGGYRVDVATPSVLDNPFRRRTIERDLRKIYGP